MPLRRLFCFSAFLMISCLAPCSAAEKSDPSSIPQPQVNVVLDRLLKAQVFKSAPLNLHVEGAPSRQTPRETFLADMLLSGIQPNHYSYFLFRNPSEPTINKFDVVFFNNDGSGYAVGIPSKLVS